MKSRRCRAVMEEVDKGCSEFCVTAGTVTRTAGILIHSRLKAMAVNLSRTSGQLWLYPGLIGSNNPRWLKADVAVCVNPSSSSSLVQVGECFFWYQLTQVVQDKQPLNGCVCVCYIHSSAAAVNHIYTTAVIYIQRLTLYHASVSTPMQGLVNSKLQPLSLTYPAILHRFHSQLTNSCITTVSGVPHLRCARHTEVVKIVRKGEENRIQML